MKEKKIAVKKKKGIIKKLNCGIYPFDVLFCVGATEDEVKKYLSKTTIPKNEYEKLDFHGRGHALQFENNSMLLWVEKADVKVIAHEVFHIVCFLAESVDQEINSKDESMAYLTEYLWSQIIEIMR